MEYYIASNNLVNFFLGKLPRNAILDYPHKLQRHNFDRIFSILLPSIKLNILEFKKCLKLLDVLALEQ